MTSVRHKNYIYWTVSGWTTYERDVDKDPKDQGSYRPFRVGVLAEDVFKAVEEAEKTIALNIRVTKVEIAE